MRAAAAATHSTGRVKIEGSSISHHSSSVSRPQHTCYSCCSPQYSLPGHIGCYSQHRTTQADAATAIPTPSDYLSALLLTMSSQVKSVDGTTGTRVCSNPSGCVAICRTLRGMVVGLLGWSVATAYTHMPHACHGVDACVN